MDRKSSLPVRIGLTLSGGGFRAAAFHLGTLMYLHRAKLLDKVQLLSTVSGGTFTGAKYALSRVDNIDPEDFFKKYYCELREIRIFRDALQLLGSPQEIDTPSRRKNIITCVAQVYSETLFGKCGRPRLFGEILNGNTGPLQEIIFNSTDFRSGIAFRFQKTQTGIVGNEKARLARGDAARMRLGEIVAASSCFPAGFEPFEFPRDFHWPDGKGPDGETDFKAHPSPLMDGGIYDNQGLGSLELRIKKSESVDMVIISDTDRIKDPLYAMPESVGELVKKPCVGFGWRVLLWCNPKLGSLAWITWLVMMLCCISACAIAINLRDQLINQPRPSVLWMIFSNIVPGLLTVSCLSLTSMVRSVFKNQLLTNIPQLKIASWKYLAKLRLVNVVDMCWLRISSLVALASEVFMKRIRASGFAKIYGDTTFDSILSANFVYSIASDKWPFENIKSDNCEGGNNTEMLSGCTSQFVTELKSIPKPSAKLLEIVDEATAVETLLWFTNDRELPVLVASGEATACFSLMKFLSRTRTVDETGKFTNPSVQELWSLLRSDWDKFQTDPFFLAPESEPAEPIASA
ncbi:MAG: patatin-like phospholipase family protein [Planctomycetaceae bacterium]